MKEWNWKRMFHYLVMFASLFILVIVHPLDWGIRVVLGLIVLLGAGRWGASLKRDISKQYQLKLQRKQASDEELFVRVMNVARHNWLNELQVLYAYIQLKKYDKLHGELEKINQKLIKESYISRLGHYSLIAFIYYYRLVHWKKFQLEVDLEHEINLTELPCRSERVSSLFQQLIQSYYDEAASDVTEPNRLLCSVRLDEEGLVIASNYQGVIDRKRLRESIGKLMLDYALDAQLEQQQYETNRVIVVIRIPFAQ